jgi:hypothetical protein
MNTNCTVSSFVAVIYVGIQMLFLVTGLTIMFDKNILEIIQNPVGH